ncbi:MAG TPA: Hsp70 family protein, partial [Blastocatellia bacterium]|nr:Hsp70 family protein [Blastocatellia bacterium]
NTRKTFPSVVWCGGKDKEIIVGHEAKVRMGQRPAPIVAVKRLMGTNRTVELGGRQVTPIEVSAHILSHARKLVEGHFAQHGIEDRIGGVIVTLPAYFDASPRRDTYEAAAKAFFDGDRENAEGRLELLLEPEAAAYAYLTEDRSERLRILVYDLGGGTFDVTILDKSPEAGLTLLRFGGDPHLGGDNIDDRLAAWMLYLLRGGKREVLDRILDPKRYEPEEMYTVLQQVLTNDVANLRGVLRPEDRDLLVTHSPLYALDLDEGEPEDRLRTQKLKALAEKAKKDFTESTEVLIAKHGAFEDKEGTTVDIDFTLSRNEFDRLIGDFIGKTMQETLGVIERAGMTRSQIDRVLLVGGSTRMPIVKEELQKAFDCPIEMKDPDLIVARGAAIRSRDLTPLPIPVSGEARPAERMTLEFPRQTSEPRVTIRGRLQEPISGHEVYVLRDGDEIATAQVEGDFFEVKEVPLYPDRENRLTLEVSDQDDNLYDEREIVIIHSTDPTPPNEGITTLLTKPIRYLGRRGFVTLFEEGTRLPAEKAIACRRATQDDFINIPFFEGERLLEELRILGIDPGLPIGAVIDLHLVINKDYTVMAKGTVRTTKQSQQVEFQISRVQIPPLEDMDRDLEDVLEQIENDIQSVRDPNRRAEFNRRRRKLEASYRKARRELDCDPHHLFVLISELRKLQIEVASAQVTLHPPFEAFERMFAAARDLASQLKPSHPVRKEDALEKIAALERAIRDIWDRANRDVIEQEDERRWNAIAEEIAEFIREIDAVREGRQGREYQPEELQGLMLEWIKSLREQVAENELDARFARDIAQVESSVRQVDTRDRESARSSLRQIIEEQLKPLSYRIERALKEVTKDPNTKVKTTVD